MGVSSRALFDAMDQQKVCYHPDKSTLAATAAAQCQAGDVLLTLGAGDITKIGHDLAKLLKSNGTPQK